MLDLRAQESAVKYVIQKFGKIDSIVLNAARTQRNIAIETDLQDTEDIMKLNFFSYASLAKLVLPSMIAKNSGQVMIKVSLDIAYENTHFHNRLLSQDSYNDRWPYRQHSSIPIAIIFPHKVVL